MKSDAAGFTAAVTAASDGGGDAGVVPAIVRPVAAAVAGRATTAVAAVADRGRRLGDAVAGGCSDGDGGGEASDAEGGGGDGLTTAAADER